MNCDICNGWLRRVLTYTHNEITTDIYAHRNANGDLHSVTRDIHTPGIPDTPPPRQSVGLRREDAEDGK